MILCTSLLIVSGSDVRFFVVIVSMKRRSEGTGVDRLRNRVRIVCQITCEILYTFNRGVRV